ncbi:HYExAFE family protein [uncultured Gimesia sp.]|uniref:HYExAFE family protein n=1 Tax=uncultured Gimesia sp. TaxID=1678688 RepID=UPI0030D91066|tara:strand:+ start:74495 stop:75010 length:516 start_codon:yes stop_codon:yes gene_type:complete
MVIRRNHYDAAFEDYLRAAKVPYVAVDEKRRALAQNASIKSLDFIVSSQQGPNLLVDVKGRTEISPDQRQSRRWENWATIEDIQGLQQWQELFGEGFISALVFAYQLPPNSLSNDLERLFPYKGSLYAFYLVKIDEYRLKMRSRSHSWQTVFLHQQDFHEMRQPVDAIIQS